MPTYQNKKGSVTVKKIKNEEEQRNRLATLQLLEEHGIEMLEGEDINLVASAVGSGQTIVLTGISSLYCFNRELLQHNFEFTMLL